MRLRKKASSFISVLLSIVMVMSSVIMPVCASTNDNAFPPKIIKQDNSYLVENIGLTFGQAERLVSYARSRIDTTDALQQLNASDNTESDTVNTLDQEVAVNQSSENALVGSTNESSEMLPIPEDITITTKLDSERMVFEEVYSAPNIPGNINTVSTADSITITWDRTSETDNYDIEADGKIIDKGSSTSYVHSGLGPNTMHTYRVRAKNGSNFGEWSDYVKKYTLLSTPTNIKASLSDKTATITWDAVSGATGYEVYRDSIIIGTASKTSYTDKDVLPNTAYNYSIKAFNDTGNISAMSNSVAVSALPMATMNSDIMVSALPATTISSNLTLTEDTIYEALDLAGGILNLNGYSLIVEGNLTQTGGTINLNGGNLNVNADFTESGGTFNIGGGSLVINDNLIQTAGGMNVNGGTLEIKGDYSIVSVSGTSYSYGTLSMTDASSRVIVHGNFIMDSTSDHSTKLTAGVLEVKGNFTQRSTYSSWTSADKKNFCANGTHRVLLSGSSLQTISFEDYTYSYSRFNELQIADMAYGVNLSTPISISTNCIIGSYSKVQSPLRLYANSKPLSGDIIIDADLTFVGGELNLEGKMLTVTGTLILQGAIIHLMGGTLNANAGLTQSGGQINLNSGNVIVNTKFEQSGGNVNFNGGSLVINGNLTQTAGVMDVNGGTLVIKGNYSIIYNTVAGYSYGILSMTDTSSRVIVHGNFIMDSARDHSTKLIAGVLEVKGNFTQRSTYSSGTYAEVKNFCAGGTHKVLLSGSSLQTVSFEDYIYSYSRFNELEISDMAFGVNLSTPISLKKNCITGSYDKIQSPLRLYANSTPLSGDLVIDTNITFVGGELNLEGKTLSVTGTLALEGIVIVHLNGGVLNANADISQSGGEINLNGGHVNVNTEFKQTGGTVNLNGGTLEVADNYCITSSVGTGFSYGILNMTNTSDRVIVGGNFIMDSVHDHSTKLTAGVLEVKGNFAQRSTYGNATAESKNFCAGGTHKVVLSGPTLQTVSFENYTTSKFNILAITKPLDTGYSFNYKPVWNTLEEIKNPTINVYPLKWITSSSQVTLRFGQVDEQYNAIHTGVDIQGVEGDDILSAADGQVVYAGYDSYYGNVVYINAHYEDKRIQTRYAHLQGGSINVSVGQQVAKGDIIGKMGNTGSAIGGSLVELELLESTDGNDCNIDGSNSVKVDPLPYFETVLSDDEYLSRPFAVSINHSDSTSSLRGMTIQSWPWEDPNDPGVRYRDNEDLDETRGEVYLRKEVEKYAWDMYRIKKEDLGPEKANILIYNSNNNTVTVKLNKRSKTFEYNQYNVINKNGRMVVRAEALYSYFFIYPTDYDYTQKGSLILLSHGLGSHVDEFAKTVLNLDDDVIFNGGTIIASAEHPTGEVTLDSNFDARIDDLGIDLNLSNVEKIKQLINKGKYVMFKTQFSDNQASHADQIQELKYFIDRLNPTNEKVILVGHSKGGLVSLGVAGDPMYKGIVKQVITVNTPYLNNTLAEIRVLAGHLPVIDEGSAAVQDLCGNTSARVDIRDNWNTNGVADAHAIAVDMAILLESDGVVSIQSQMGGDFYRIQERLLRPYQHYWFYSPNKYFHTECPDRSEISREIKRIIVGASSGFLQQQFH